MAFIDSLLEQGYTFQGMPRKTIDTNTGQVGFEDNSVMGRFAKGLQSFMLAQQKEMEKQQKENQRKADMYKTLREAGYDTKSAYDATMKGTFPSAPGEETIKGKEEIRKQEESKLNLEKTTAEIAKTKRETELLVPANEKTESGRFRAALNQARRGEISWDDLEMDYPDKVDTIRKIQKQVTPVAKSPLFKEGSGLGAFFNKDVAKMTANAQSIISQIKSQDQLDKFIKQAPKWIGEQDTKTGKKWTQNDINTVLEYYGMR